ncbi:MAG: transglycosylase SLT domain-containing protein [Proteobacteria bacterium]|nr:transglycosylase SLT domain-containing protein [Ottowia sp.]MBS0405809.1 transglycosylase SLT domain-containing protein [Pseudomonadota bacterium]
MKFLHVLALGACVWLAGCAAPQKPSADHTTGAAASPTIVNGTAGAMPAVAVTELPSSSVAPLAAPKDLWERIRRGFSMPDLDTDLVRKQEQWYLARPDYIERMTERSRMYIFHVVEELELRGMPTELALLPYIESAFNPQAISSAKAAGLWQFMPGTGRDFQLTQNVLRDDRRSVLESTRAALDYLQMLHDMFGDWHLALAAYNWGQGNVSKAIARNKAAGLPAGYLDLNMPAETRNYVPKLQAVKNIIARPETFGAVLPLIENHPFFDTVEITRDIDIEMAARLAEVRLEDFKALNPSQRKPIIFAAGTPQVLLPWDNAATFKKNLSAADPTTLASWTAWVAPATMPTREAAQRVHMDEDDLRQLNGVPKGMVIKQGSTLVVPRNGQTPAAVASSVVNNAQVAFTPEVVLRRTVVRARRGDTIARVAARYDLPAGTVAGWNKSNAGAALKAGHAVVVYLPVRASSAAASESARHRAASRTSSSASRKAVAGQARHGSSARKAAAPSARKAAPARSTAKRAPARPQKKHR